MPKVDTTGWKQFRIGDLFEIELAKGDIQPKQVEDGDVPLVSAGNEDNGIVATIDVVGDGISEIFPGGCITVSMFGKAFYQNAPFYAVSHGRVNILRMVVPISDLSGLFVAGCLNRQFANKFGYTAMCTRTRLLSEIITLPATPAGDPDWAYMDAYMSEIMQKEEVYASHLASLTAEAVADGHVLDTSGWKAFRIGELFEKLSLGFKAGRKFDKALDVSTEPSDEFDLPLVNAKDGDNGVMYWGRSSDWDSAEMTLDIVMDGAVSAGNVYAQPQSTGVLYNAYLIKPFCAMSANCLQFVATVMQSAIKEQFGYMNKCTWDRVSALFIYLPVTSAGQPDWAWTEQYMQQQMDKAEALVEHLAVLWNG